MEVIRETLWKRCLSTPTKPPAKIATFASRRQHTGTKERGGSARKQNQAAIIQWQRQRLMDKPHRKPWPKSKTNDISKQSPSPLHHTFLLGHARFTAQPLSALIANEAEGGHEGERNNCLSKIKLVGQKYRDKATIASKTRFSCHWFDFHSQRFSLLVGYDIWPSSRSTNQNAALTIDH